MIYQHVSVYQMIKHLNRVIENIAMPLCAKINFKKIDKKCFFFLETKWIMNKETITKYCVFNFILYRFNRQTILFDFEANKKML